LDGIDGIGNDGINRGSFLDRINKINRILKADGN
jgi:hypothetical protein